MKIAKVNDINKIISHFEDGEMLVIQAENSEDLKALNSIMSGLQKRISNSKEEDKRKYCEGCEDDFYNDNNPLGIGECWYLKSAELVFKKKVALSDVPPWNMKPIKVLSCYRQKGYVFVDKNINK